MDRFKGRLTTEQIDAGVQACLDNAERLRRSGLLLAENDDAALAVFVGCIRVEELAKAALLMQLREGSVSPSMFCKRWYSHAKKWGEYKVLTMDAVEGWSEEERDAILRQGSWRDAQFKNIALYVDFREDRGWMIPAELPLEDQVLHVMLLGDGLLGKIAPEQLPPSWDA